MNHLRKAALVVTVLLAWAASAQAHADPTEVYGRLVAPCCWNQTLDIHDSEVSTQLRVEIAQRLAQGEAALSIEDDMARRFGERIRAVPRAQDPRHSMAVVVFAALLAALAGLVFVARRWSRPGVAPQPEAPSDEYDAALDRELRG